MHKKLTIKSIASAVYITVLAVLFPVSCAIYEDLDPCPTGLKLRLTSNYNMEFANAFPAKVDCFTTYVYDQDGNYLESFSDQGEALKEEAYRLPIELPEGNYQLLTYGGMTCEKSSFKPISIPAAGSTLKDMQVALQQETEISDQLLHGFYYGTLPVQVEKGQIKEATTDLMCNTNNIRIILQHLDDEPVKVEQFDFMITDDNARLDFENNRLTGGEVTYRPWAKGMTAATTKSITPGAYAEFSTSRLFADAQTRLVVRRTEDKEVTIDIPLIPYLEMLRSDQYSKMGNQEFLDREHDWNILFFLNEDEKWIETRIVINGWTVRLNEIDPLNQ